MIYNAGDFPTSATVYIPINTFDSNDPTASVTATNLVNTDVHIHKDGGTTQRNNAAGITMTIDFGSITGNHLLIIDTSNNTVADFYQAGHEYQVRVEGVTVDGATINAWVGSFSIERAGGALALIKNGTYGLSALNALLAHADYGLAKLVRSTTPANTLTVDASHRALSDLASILGTALTETAGQIAAAFKKFFDKATPTGTVNSLPDAVAGANGGLPTQNGSKLNQTVDLTAGQTIACSDKTGFALSATGADLILKNSTFIGAIVAAINEFATYGLTALNTLLVTTGIKAASIPDVTLATAQANYAPAKAGDKMDLVDAPNATGISAIVTAINNLATYGLTALYTLLVSTGIKAATIPEVTLAATQANYAPAKVGDLGTVQTADNNVILEKIESMLEASSPGYKFTADALQEAPTGGSAPTAVAIRQEIDSNSTQLAAIVADTNEVQGDLANGGRLGLLIDGIKGKTDNLPSDPADEIAIEAAITAATSPLATSTALAAVKTIADKLDNMIEVVP